MNLFSSQIVIIITNNLSQILIFFNIETQSFKKTKKVGPYGVFLKKVKNTLTL